MNARLFVAALAAVALGSCSGSGAARAPAASASTASASTSSNTAPSSTSATSSTSSTSSTAATSSTTALTPTKVTKVLVVVVENHSLAQMQSAMPYTFALAKRYGYADHYTAIRHPSLPNYLAIASGSTHGVTDDRDPSAHRLHGATVFGTAVAARRTAGVYADAMSAPCRATSAGRYAVRHNPWTYFVDERVACQKYDRPMGSFTTAVRAGTLPAAGMLVPDLCHDAHDCSLATADAWFRDRMRTITAGPDWRSGRLVVVLTADEDDRTAGNRVLTVVAHPALSHVVVHTPMTHYSLTRLYAEVTHTRALGSGVSAPSMARAFGLRTS
ncbi:alkaline phosphatase family protein [Pedococcus sp. KACC 23699]|uniref:Alkaline phosphatase family protein n=1 Tax=Pedococcus sp. KACC 23699 TaxID=3149228 RepID=A0AAU7JSW3_9MICO